MPASVHAPVESVLAGSDVEGAGANGTRQVDFDTEVHHVFMTYSYNVIDYVDNKTIKLNL